MPLTRFEECWPLPKESLPELPRNLNVVTLTLTLWPINSGLLISPLHPHLSSSLSDSLPSFNLLCHSKTHARFMQDGRKAVWSIPHLSVAFFSLLKILLHIVLLKCPHVQIAFLKSGFCTVYSNCCCSCSFEAEIIKIGQSSYKMYCYNIRNCQESTTIFNACTKKVWNLIDYTSYAITILVRKNFKPFKFF